MMMKIHASTDYSRIFNSLCHFLALSKTVDTKAVLDNLVITAIALDRESNPILIDDIASAIEVFFSTTLTESELLESLNQVENNGASTNWNGDILTINYVNFAYYEQEYHSIYQTLNARTGEVNVKYDEKAKSKNNFNIIE